MRVPSDEEGNLVGDFNLVKQNHSLRRSTQQVPGFEAQSERRSRNLSQKDIALLQPLHVALVYLFRR